VAARQGSTHQAKDREKPRQVRERPGSVRQQRLEAVIARAGQSFHLALSRADQFGGINQSKHPLTRAHRGSPRSHQVGSRRSADDCRGMGPSLSMGRLPSLGAPGFEAIAFEGTGVRSERASP